MKIRVSSGVSLALASLAGAATTLVAQERPELTASQRDLLEQRTCQAWHSRSFAETRTEFLAGGRIAVSFECQAHDLFNGMPLAALGYCEGVDLEWKCDPAGLELTRGELQRPRFIRLVDMAPQKAVELADFIAAEARKGKRLGEGILDGHLALFELEAGVKYSATIRFQERVYELEILARCSSHGCRYRLGDVESYYTYPDL